MNPKIQFTPEEVELAAKVSNDIAEDIDFGFSSLASTKIQFTPEGK